MVVVTLRKHVATDVTISPVRILLDASDLIDLVEHGRPQPSDVIVKTLRERSWQVVFSNTSVSEFAAAIRHTSDRLKVRALLVALDQLPHLFIRDAFIEPLEFTAAYDAFRINAEPMQPDVFAMRWDDAMVPIGRPTQTEQTVGLRIHDIVFKLDRDGVFDWSSFSRSTMAALVEDRESRKTSNVSDFDRFWRTLAARMRIFSIGPSDPNERKRFAKWLAIDPRRCPGTWFAYRTREELIRNAGDLPKIGDLADLNHMCCVPYVTATTFDKRMLGYARAAAVRVKKMHGIDYAPRLFANLQGVLAGA